MSQVSTTLLWVVPLDLTEKYSSSNKEMLVLLAYCSHAEPHIEAAMAHIDAISNLEAASDSGEDGYRYVCVLANVLSFIP